MKNFEIRKEISSSFRDKELKNFTFQGKEVFKNKNEIQEEVLRMSKTFIIEELRRLDIDDKLINDFEMNRTTYDISLDILNPALYSANADIVLMNKTKEVNFGTIIHEMLHAYSSQYRTKEVDSVIGISKKNKKSVKSGFQVSWYKKGFENNPSSINFSQINEAITEKLARELVEKNYDKIVTFGNKYREYIEKQKEKHFNEMYSEVVEMNRELYDKINNIRNVWNNRREEYKIEIEQVIHFLKNIYLKNKISDEEFKEYLENTYRMQDEYLNIIRVHEEEQIKILKSSAVENLKLKMDLIELDYSLEKYNLVYQDYIDILDILIEGIALKHTQTASIGELESEKEKFWKDLKRAYFTGNTMFLRIFDKTYNDSILRQFNELDGDDINVEYLEFILKIKEKNNEFFMKILENKN